MPEIAALDPRIHAFRPDLADITLRDSVKAARYAEPMLRQCVRGVVPLLKEPKADARRVSEIRYGEFLDVFDLPKDGFAWVQNRMDRYVGYVSAHVLSEEIGDLSNRINVLKSFVYPEPDIKAPPVDCLTLGSFVRLGERAGDCVGLIGGGYVFAKHVAPSDEALTSDYVFTAGRMLKAPYLWGGRTPLGIDCSGLVQLALEMAGIDVPRDSDQQREAFGQPLPCHWRDMRWQRGDVIFFPGHVGIMTGQSHMIHASGHDMEVVVEPLEEIVFRGAEIVGMGRPSF